MTGAACALEVVGVELPERVRLGGSGPELILNGAGVRMRAFFKIYVSALYLTTRISDGEAVLNEDQPRRLSLFFLRDVTSEQLATSTSSALHNTLTAAERRHLEGRLSQFNAMLGTLPELRKGTEIVIDYVPTAGTTFRVDGNERQRIPGADFNRALMRIWLGERPNDPQLKKAMLGAF